MSDQVVLPACPRCKNKKTSRTKREGLLQRFVLHRFGLFPWECSNCRKVFLFKSRGKLKRRRNHSGEVHLPPI